jgi:hypothetical protein
VEGPEGGRGRPQGILGSGGRVQEGNVHRRSRVGLKGVSEPEAEAPGAKQKVELGDGRV